MYLLLWHVENFKGLLAISLLHNQFHKKKVVTMSTIYTSLDLNPNIMFFQTLKNSKIRILKKNMWIPWASFQELEHSELWTRTSLFSGHLHHWEKVPT